jgi:hypothetical protein
VANTTSVSAVGDNFARLKVNVFGDDHGAVAVALLPYVKLPTAQSGLGNGKMDDALTYALTPNLQLDFGGNFGLNGAAPRAQLYGGLSQRF